MPTQHPRWQRHPIVRRLRSPLVHWAIVAVCILLVVWRVVTVIDRAEAERRAWGETEQVAVAAVDLVPGDPVGGDTIVWRNLPASVLPEGRLDVIPPGSTARSRIDAGEILVGHRVAGAGGGSDLPSGTAAVDVVLPVAPARLEIGDLVDVVVTFPVAPGAAEPAEIVTQGATVLGLADRTVSIAVRSGDLTAVAHALATGFITLAVVG
ncbi:MAG: SAF domain-containing protein [Acidimicrobiales bacterium]